MYLLPALLVGLDFVKGMFSGGFGETKLVVRVFLEKEFLSSPGGGWSDRRTRVRGA